MDEIPGSLRFAKVYVVEVAVFFKTKVKRI